MQINEYVSEIIKGYAEVMKISGTNIKPVSELSVDDYLKLRETAIKEMYYFENSQSESNTKKDIESNNTYHKTNNEIDIILNFFI